MLTVLRLQVGQIGLPVLHDDELGGAVHDMVVREQIAVLRDEEPRAGRVKVGLPLSGVVRQPGEVLDLHVVADEGVAHSPLRTRLDDGDIGQERGEKRLHSSASFPTTFTLSRLAIFRRSSSTSSR